MQDTTCCHCGCVLNTEDQFCFDDEIYCEDCLEEVTVVCDHCGHRISRDADAGNENITLCAACYHRYYVTCDRCNRILLEDDACPIFLSMRMLPPLRRLHRWWGKLIFELKMSKSEK